MSQSAEVTEAGQRRREFRAAIPVWWLVAPVQLFLRLVLPIRARIHVRKEDIEFFRAIKGKGMILTPNHADELDPPICMELSRQVSKQFMMMCNREAFDEYLGIAGWVFQRIGVFSVERGGHDVAARQFAADVVKSSHDVLLIFPEGEIYYLNELVQPFHTGAVDIGIQAILEKRKSDPAWTAVVVPMAIKYRYPASIKKVLEQRVNKMEQRLSQDLTGFELKKRLASIISKMLQQQELEFGIDSEGDRFAQLSERVRHVRDEILAPLERKYSDAYNEQSRTIDRVFQLSASVRKRLKQTVTNESQEAYKKDLDALQEVAHMVSWQPQYIDDDPSIDRLAEMVLKLERELYKIKRPAPLCKRDVYIRLAPPVDLGCFLEDFEKDPHAARQNISEQLRRSIQSLINEIASGSRKES